MASKKKGARSGFRAPNSIKSSQLKAIEFFGARELRKRGKGSHRFFIRIVDGERQSAPVPKRDGLSRALVDSVRRQLKLAPEHGVSDEEFYSRT